MSYIGEEQTGARAQARLVRGIESRHDGARGSTSGQAHIAHACGGFKPAPKVTPRDLVRVRQHLRLSRALFAVYLRTNVRTLENWEQGRAKPNAQAALLINLVKRFPDTVERSPPSEEPSSPERVGTIPMNSVRTGEEEAHPEHRHPWQDSSRCELEGCPSSVPITPLPKHSRQKLGTMHRKITDLPYYFGPGRASCRR